MIRNTEFHDEAGHCALIQERRVKSGKRGYAKAVRRWLKKRMESYAIRDSLPVIW